MRLRHFLFALALPIALGLLLVACGDDDDGGGAEGASSGGGNGSDEQYMKTICVAFNSFEADLTKIEKEIGATSDPAKILEKIADPFDKFAKNFAKANPPKDIKEWHSQASKALSDTAAALKKGNDPSVFEKLAESPLPDPPQSIQDRMLKAAGNIKECQGTALFE